MKPPEQVIAALHDDINPAHGIWELHRRYSDAFALLTGAERGDHRAVEEFE